jgi:hypothetical protein
MACVSVLGSTISQWTLQQTNAIEDAVLGKSDSDGESEVEKGAGTRVRGVEVSKQFRAAMEFSTNTRIWDSGDGDIVPYKAVRGDIAWSSRRGGDPVPRGAFVGLDGALLDPAYFEVQAIAEKRAKEYADAAIRGDYNFMGDISAVTSTAKKAASNELDRWKRQHSTDNFFINSSAMTKDVIYAELQVIRDNVPDMECFNGEGFKMPSKASTTKPVLAALLCLAREEFQSIMPPPQEPTGDIAKRQAEQVAAEGFSMNHWQMKNLL